MENKNIVFRNLVGGEWVKSAQSILINSPVDGSQIGYIPAMSKSEVDSVINHSKASQQEWTETPIYMRGELLYKTAALLEERENEIAETLVMEIAKDYKSAVSEVRRTADFLRFTADVGKNIEGVAVGGENFPGGSKNKISYVKRVPLGTVLAISPFNYPVNLSASKIGPALMGGNTVILKPATQGAISALKLVKAFHDAGLPAGVLNTVTGKGSEIGDYLVAHSGIDFVNFTGSTQVGRHISQLVRMTPLMLELGGKDAAIILPDANLEFTASNIVDGAFSYSGQRCTAVKRILTTGDIADRLVPLLKKKVEGLKVGDPRDSAVITPLIDMKAADFAQGLIDDALSKGAKLITGNRRDKTMIYPTLLDEVKEGMRIAWEEPFAPVLPILRVKDLDEAISLANKSEYGLQSSVFTNNIDAAFYVANRLDVGTVQINNKTERGPDHFPFLGVKASGMGTQGVRYSIDAMTRPKAIVLNLANQD